MVNRRDQYDLHSEIHFCYWRVLKWILLHPAGQTNPFFDLRLKRKRMEHGKNIHFTGVIFALALLDHHTWHSQNELFLLEGHKVDFIASCGDKFFFWPPSRKKSCVTRETKVFYSCSCYPRFARASKFTLTKYILFSLVPQYSTLY